MVEPTRACLPRRRPSAFAEGDSGGRSACGQLGGQAPVRVMTPLLLDRPADPAVPRDDRDLRAVPSEDPRDALADPLARTGNDNGFPAIDVSMRPRPRTFWLQQCSNPNTCVRVLVENGIEGAEER